MQPVYAIGDIHGQKAMLDHALDLIAADGGPDAQIVFLGDYTDRGPDSRGVIDTLMAGQATGRNWVFLRGNHDRMFTRFVRLGATHDPQVLSGIHWLNPRLGGTATLASYGIISDPPPKFSQRPGRLEVLECFSGYSFSGLLGAARAAVPDRHLTFLESLPLWHQTDDLLFVHAGLRPGVPLAEQTEDDLIWIRGDFLDSNHDFGRLVVHGHTALDFPQHFGNRVDLDGGAGYSRPLLPAVFEGRDCWILTDRGRLRLLPGKT